MNAQAVQMPVVNGVNVSELCNTMRAVHENPNLARFKFRIRNEWLDCGHSRSTVSNFQGASQEQRRASTFVLDADEPPILHGQDKGANPVEHLLHALAACVTTAMVYHAAAKGIYLEEVESTIEGDLDLRGFLGMEPRIRNGYEGIRMKFRVRADVSDSELQELVQLGSRFSPVFDSLCHGVPITVFADRL